MAYFGVLVFFFRRLIGSVAATEKLVCRARSVEPEHISGFFAVVTQRAQHGLITECTLNHVIDPYIVEAIFLS